MGRPTEYSEKVLKDTESYLTKCKDSYKPIKDKKGNVLVKRFVVSLPSVASLAVYLKVARKTIYNWSEQNPAFLHILERILAEQEKRLIDCGLSGEYNATIAKLVLGKHGYKDLGEQENPTQIEELKLLRTTLKEFIDKK